MPSPRPSQGPNQRRSQRPILSVVVVLLSSTVFVASALAQSAGQPKSPAAERVVAIRAASLIDGVAEQVRHNVLIVIKGNKIESVTDGGTPPVGATAINLPA